MSKSIMKPPFNIRLFVALGLLTALLLAFNLAAHADPCCSKLNQAESESVWIVGHRGAAGLKPENTLSGFARALELGVDAIELDVLMTADKVLVVHHDYTLKPETTRNSDGSWLQSHATNPIKEMTFNQLLAFDVGRLKPGTRYASKYPQQVPTDGQKVPMLRDVIQLMKNSQNTAAQLWIEIKTSPESPRLTPPPEDVAQYVVALLQDQLFTQKVKILSFD